MLTQERAYCVHSVFPFMTRSFYESHLNWVPDPTPPAPRRLDDLTSPTAVTADPTPPSEARPKLPGRSRRRRRRKKKAAALANKNAALRAADLTTPPTRSTNDNSARCKKTRPGSRANQLPARPPGTKSTSVEHPSSFTSSPVTQHPFSATNENSDCASRRDHPERQGVYKPARIDPSQDLTATHLRDNISGLGLSSPSLQQPPTKSFSGLPSRPNLTSPHREAREAGRERPGIVYPLLPCAARPDTQLQIDAALTEAAVLDRRNHPPTVVDIPEARRTTENRLPEPSQPRGSSSPRRQSSKRPRNRSSGVYRPKKRSPHRSYWCE